MQARAAHPGSLVSSFKADETVKEDDNLNAEPSIDASIGHKISTFCSRSRLTHMSPSCSALVSPRVLFDTFEDPYSGGVVVVHALTAREMWMRPWVKIVLAFKETWDDLEEPNIALSEGLGCLHAVVMCAGRKAEEHKGECRR